jgi:hypothetical protein
LTCNKGKQESKYLFGGTVGTAVEQNADQRVLVLLALGSDHDLQRRLALLQAHSTENMSLRYNDYKIAWASERGVPYTVGLCEEEEEEEEEEVE